jgi:plastocyanin
MSWVAGTILSATLIVAGAGCSAYKMGGKAADAVKKANVTVSMQAKPYVFIPSKVMAAPGETIAWVNDSPYPHAVIADDNTSPNGPNSANDLPHGIFSGRSWSWTVPKDAKPGTKWIYHCQFHGEPGDGKEPGIGMAGIIEVR